MSRLLEHLPRWIVDTIDAERATVFAFAGNLVVVEASFDRAGSPAPVGTAAPGDLFRPLVQEREPRGRTYPFEPFHSLFAGDLADVRYSVTVPVVAGEEVRGLLVAHRRGDRPFGADAFDSLTRFAEIAALALDPAGATNRTGATRAQLLATEEAFSLFIEQVQDYAIFILDPSGHVASWNAGIGRIKRYAPEEIIGRHFSVFYTPDDVAAGKPARALAAAAEQGRWEDEGWRVRKDGSRFWASVVITAVHEADGGLRGFVKVTRDLTERKRLQDRMLEAQRRETERFQQLAERAERLEQAKSQFLNLASHELRTPVSVIGGYVSMLEEGDFGRLDDRGREALAVIQTQARELALLVEQMLEAAEVRIGIVDLRCEDFDLREVIADSVEWARTLATESHRLSFVAVEEPVPVTADRRRTSAIVRSLLDNAIKYSPAGGDISCHLFVKSDSAHVEIRDEGIGLDPDQLDQMFNRFGRVVTGRTADIPGLGLGLYLALELARMQGGDIKARPMPGEGAIFTLTLPLGAQGAAAVTGNGVA